MSIPVPLAEWADAVLEEGDQIDPRKAPGGPNAARHRQRAELGQAVAYNAAAENPWLVKVGMSHQLPSWWPATTDHWDVPGWLPAGAFGEDAGPT